MPQALRTDEEIFRGEGFLIAGSETCESLYLVPSLCCGRRRSHIDHHRFRVPILLTFSIDERNQTMFLSSLRETLDAVGLNVVVPAVERRMKAGEMRWTAKRRTFS